MRNRNQKPNPRTEQILHHGPVTDMLDGHLLTEIRLAHLPAAARAAAERAAKLMSWQLHSLVAYRVDEI